MSEIRDEIIHPLLVAILCEMRPSKARAVVDEWETMMMSIDELELSTRARHALEINGICTIADLVQTREEEMLRWPNFGRKSLDEIKELLGSHGLTLRREQ